MRSKSLLKLALFGVICLWSGSTVARTMQSPLHIMIDPGHGGSDKGAVRGSLVESEIALQVANYLADILRADPRFKVSMTRTGDQRISLRQRTELARKVGADLFISIHLNSSPDPRAHGTEIYFQNQLPADEEALFLVSRESADEETNDTHSSKSSEPISVQTDLKRILEDLRRNERIRSSGELSKVLYETLTRKGQGPKLGSRAIRQAPFHVVSEIDIPSVLVELGFLSHPQEGPRLKQPDYQRELARLLAEGLVKYKESLTN